MTGAHYRHSWIDLPLISIRPTRSSLAKNGFPGVDNDPHLFVFYWNGLGSNVAGYSSSTDVVLPEVHKYSNAHEMFYINAEVADSD